MESLFVLIVEVKSLLKEKILSVTTSIKGN